MSIGINTREVPAAGGLVINARGEYLMIFRNGVWDLPKGHREEGEDMVQTALREVAEETGVKDLQAGDLLRVTEHWYFRDGCWCHKFTSWYLMSTSASGTPVPQEEEGITEVKWIPAAELDYYLERTYSTIRDVFRAARAMKLIL